MFDPVKKIKLKTFQSGAKKVKVQTTENKIITYQPHSSVAIQLLVKSQTHGQVSIEELMKYPMSPVPYSHGTPDGYMTRRDKTKGKNHLLKGVTDAPFPSDAKTLLIQDGNATFRAIYDRYSKHFELISYQIFDNMPKRVNFLFSTDMYHDGSIKDMEREQCGSSEKLIIGGQLTKRPADWKDFLMNSENKSQLVHVMNEVWCSDAFAHKLQNRKIVSMVQGYVYLLESEDAITMRKTEIPEIFSDQEETDTRVILCCAYVPKQGYEIVRIHSPDRDIFFILLHHASKFDVKILFDTGSGNNRKLTDISDLSKVYGQELCITLMISSCIYSL